MDVRTAVIPAAGRGTRMRPATRAVPKALLPVVDRPAVQWVVEEAVRAGATRIVVVVDPGVGELVERHFNSQEEGPLPGLDHVEVHAVTQEVPRGLGDAVRVAGRVVGDEPFFCLLVDNFVHPGHDVLPAMAEGPAGRSVVCLRELTTEFLARYGVVVPGEPVTGELFEVLGAIEKPGPERAPSRLGLVGRYLFTPDVIEVLADVAPGVGGEIQLTDAIAALGEAGRCLGYVAPMDLLDTGSPDGYLEATTELGVTHPQWGADYRKFLAAFTPNL